MNSVLAINIETLKKEDMTAHLSIYTGWIFDILHFENLQRNKFDYLIISIVLR